jgi:transcriptional regulator with XRE-family HTH domain
MSNEGPAMSNEAPVTPRKAFGAILRGYRLRAGLTQAELGAKVHVVGDVISKIETGERPPAHDLVPRLDAVPELATGGMLAEFYEALGDGLRESAYPDWFGDWPSKEATAKRLRWFEPLLVPGLLQTEAYMRAIFGTRFGATEADIEARVAGRLKRQEILVRDDPPKLWVLLDEGVLRRPVGGPQVMYGQVSRLVEDAARPHIMIQIIPAGVGEHEGLLGASIIADSADGPSVGYQEGAVRGQLIDDTNDVESLAVAWDTLRGEALPRKASLALLEELARTWSSAQ